MKIYNFFFYWELMADTLIGLRIKLELETISLE